MIGRYCDPATVDSDVILVVHVLNGNIQTVGTRNQRQGLPVDRLTFKRLLQQFRRLIDFDGILKRLHCLARNRRHLAKNVHQSLCHAVFGHKRDVAILDLQSDRNQVHAFGHLHKVRAHIEGKDRAG